METPLIYVFWYLEGGDWPLDPPVPYIHNEIRFLDNICEQPLTACKKGVFWVWDFFSMNISLSDVNQHVIEVATNLYTGKFAN